MDNSVSRREPPMERVQTPMPRIPTPQQVRKVLSRYLSEPIVEHIMFEIWCVTKGKPLYDGAWVDGLPPVGEPEGDAK